MGFADSVSRLRTRTRAGGAGASGLASLLEVCAINSAADTFVAIALADTVFFADPAEARGRVAIYLITTMAPFALLAPIIGPLLDRFSHGRRIALAATFLVRGFLAWSLAGSLAGNKQNLAIYPVALGVLIGSRAFSVAKSSAVPRVLPHGVGLVQANSRLSIAGVVAAVISAPLAVGINKVFHHGAALRVAALIFLIGVLLSFALPSHVDSSRGETRAIGVALPTGRKRGGTDLGGTPHALRSQAAVRGLIGFLTLFLAFKLRGDANHNGSTAALGALAAAASLGSALGVGIGGRLRRFAPEGLLTMALLTSLVACALGAFFYTVPFAIVIALAVATAASLGKLALDSVIQRDVVPSAQASAFGKSETALQLAWVVGGALGLIPWAGPIGFGLAAFAMAMAFLSRLSHQRPPHAR